MTKLTKVSLFTIMSSLLLFTVAINSRRNQDKVFVILSTNDMHAQIDKFPALVSAVEACRDTIDVVLVDAGDRWTGNAFVDLVEYYTPIYELMNYMKYDVAIYGNHEFDKGQAYLAVANRQAEFPIIGANIVSDTTSFPQPRAHQVVEVGGKKIAFVGVVGNYDANGHPAGKDESYEGITFTNPHTAAAQYGYLANECDMLVMVSHSGLERDIEFAESDLSQGYHHIISAHSHDTAIETVNGKLVSQTGSRLKNIGATVVTITKEGEVRLSHRNIALQDYQADPKVATMVAAYYDNAELNASIGRAKSEFDEVGMCNLFAETLRARVKADVGIYHAGGVRIESLPVGDISMANILNAEPFGSYIATATMSVDNLRELVMTKFNDKVNVGEAHYIDLVMTTPYTVLTDSTGDAVDVVFSELDPKKSYTVSMGDYIYKTYRGLNYTKGSISEILVTTTLEEYVKSLEAIEPSNVALQKIEPQEAI